MFKELINNIGISIEIKLCFPFLHDVIMYIIYFQVGKACVFAPLISILKTVCRDSILGRTCRLIGNLAQKNVNAEGLHNLGVVSALVTLIQSRNKNTSHATLTMAVRAIR